MTSVRFVQPQLEPAHPEFREDDEVALAEATYEGTVGIFLHLRHDVKWADIAERTTEISAAIPLYARWSYP